MKAFLSYRRLKITFIISVLLGIFSVYTIQITNAALISESCTTGVYATTYGITPSCNICGYFSPVYINTGFDTWDWFYNLDGIEKVISGSSFWNIIPLNGSNLTIWQQPILVSNMFPAGFGINSKKEALIFSANTLKFSTAVANRNTPIGRVEYTIRSANVVPTWSVPYNFPWSYYSWAELVWPSGITNMTAVQINLWTSTKNIDPATISNHKECYVFLGAWCWDWVLDTGYEICDPADPAKTGWGTGGCSATACTPIVTPPVACIPWTTVWAQTTAITAATAGLCPTGQIVWGFTSAVVGTTTNYTWSCNGSAVGGTCSASYTTSIVPPPGWGGWGGGWGGGCQIGSITGVQSSPVTMDTPGLCASGPSVVSAFTTVSTVGNITTYKWSCNQIYGCTTTYQSGGWGGITVPGSSSYCGNGFVERPNAIGQYENCDTTAAWCQGCNIGTTNPGRIDPGRLTITTPGYSTVDINAFKLILGHQVPVFGLQDVVAFETNTPIYFQNKIATLTNSSPLIQGANVSKIISNVWVGGSIRFKTGETKDALGNILTITYDERVYPSSITLFQGSEPGLQGFMGDTTSIVGDYADTNMMLPMFLGTGFYATFQFLEAPFNIRVSKPIIANTAGGSAFIGSALGNSVNAVTANFMTALKNGNFTTSTINVNPSFALSSATKSTSNNSLLSQAIASGSLVESLKIANASSVGLAEILTVINITSEYDIDPKSVPLGDTNNIRVFKDGDVSIDGTLDLAGVKTIVIENGNLIINNNIRYMSPNASFAWIIKNGNIIVADSVTEIAWVYVTLAGSILSNGISTPNRLTVDGSLYGNTTDLVNHRSYVRGQTGYSALNVGVIVNYSNRAIMYPPPFLSSFLDQYSLQRVVQ